MLKDAKHILPTLPVTDLERSKKFYRDTLGLNEIRRNYADGGVDYGSRGGPQLHLFPKPGITASGNTMAVFFVDDLQATVKDLKRRGATFEHFDAPGVTWEGDVAVMTNDKIAWFKDPDGHWLAVTTEPE